MPIYSLLWRGSKTVFFIQRIPFLSERTYLTEEEMKETPVSTRTVQICLPDKSWIRVGR